jgi:hypothetical protein
VYKARNNQRRKKLMNDSKQAKDLAKYIADVEKARLKFAERSYASLSAIEARAANRVKAAEGGSTALQVTRSVSKHLHHVSNLDSLVSFAESSQFTTGNSAAFPTGMPLPRTPQASKPAAGSSMASGGGKKGKKSKQGLPPQSFPARQDKQSKPPKMAQDHQTIGILPALSKTCSRNTEFETTVHDMAGCSSVLLPHRPITIYCFNTSETYVHGTS